MRRARRAVVTPAEWLAVTIGAGGILAVGAYLLAFHLRDALAFRLNNPFLLALR